MAEQDPEARWIELAEALRKLRLTSGLSGPQLASRTGWSQSKVSRYENRTTRPSVPDVVTWVEETGGSDRDRDRLAGLATVVLSERKSWAQSLAAGLGKRQNEVADVEAKAHSVRVFDPHLVPGLYQTPEYADQIYRMLGSYSDEDIAEGVAARMNRQRILYLPAKTFTLILGEAALRWWPDVPDLRAGQLHRLLDLANRANVELGILPLDVPWPALPLAFWIYDDPDDPRVLVEDASGDELLAGDRVQLFLDRFDAIMAAAITGPEARAFIEALLP
jgi:transcriptional regulator with XRE-family HTH domain